MRPRTPASNLFLLVALAAPALSAMAPFFGRKALVWIVNASGLGIIVAYALVAVSFLVLRRREPNMDRPFKVSYGTQVGYGALILAFGICLLYLPGSPAALVWPYEWGIVLVGVLMGCVFYVWARILHGRQEAAQLLDQELRTGHSDLPETKPETAG